MSKISHILLPNPVVVPTGTTLIDAAKLMKKNKVTSVLVKRDNKLAGIISVVDIMVWSVEGRLDIEAEEVMHSPELTIDSEKWLTDAIAMFDRLKVSHIAVLEDGEKIGIISADDILHTYRFNALNAESQYL